MKKVYFENKCIAEINLDAEMTVKDLLEHFKSNFENLQNNTIYIYSDKINFIANLDDMKFTDENDEN